MRADDGVVTGERHVQKVLTLEEAGEGIGQTLVVVVPPEAELGRRDHGGRRRVGRALRRGHAQRNGMLRRSQGDDSGGQVSLQDCCRAARALVDSWQVLHWS